MKIANNKELAQQTRRFLIILCGLCAFLVSSVVLFLSESQRSQKSTQWTQSFYFFFVVFVPSLFPFLKRTTEDTEVAQRTLSFY